MNWKKVIVDGVETNYSVSDTGEVRNDKYNRLLKQSTDCGYKVVGLSYNSR